MWLVFHGGVYSTYIGSHVIVQVYRNNTLEIITGRLALREGPGDHGSNQEGAPDKILERIMVSPMTRSMRPTRS